MLNSRMASSPGRLEDRLDLCSVMIVYRLENLAGGRFLLEGVVSSWSGAGSSGPAQAHVLEGEDHCLVGERGQQPAIAEPLLRRPGHLGARSRSDAHRGPVLEHWHEEARV